MKEETHYYVVKESKTLKNDLNMCLWGQCVTGASHLEAVFKDRVKQYL